jgi:hypothetical protein
MAGGSPRSKPAANDHVNGHPHRPSTFASFASEGVIGASQREACAGALVPGCRADQ